MLFGDSEQKRKQKEQRSREKDWKSKLLGTGMEKGAAGELVKRHRNLGRDFRQTIKHQENIWSVRSARLNFYWMR